MSGGIDRIEAHIIALNARLRAMQKQREVVSNVLAAHDVAVAHGFSADLTTCAAQDGHFALTLTVLVPVDPMAGEARDPYPSQQPHEARDPAGDARRPYLPSGRGNDPAPDGASPEHDDRAGRSVVPGCLHHRPADAPGRKPDACVTDCPARDRDLTAADDAVIVKYFWLGLSDAAIAERLRVCPPRIVARMVQLFSEGVLGQLPQDDADAPRA